VTAVKSAQGEGEGDGNGNGEEVVLWTKEAMPEDRDRYGFTHFARHCNSVAGCPPGLLASDARLRPDRAALEAGNQREAGAWKKELEEVQRAERRTREERGDQWTPR
jgi:hypothetical protein